VRDEVRLLRRSPARLPGRPRAVIALVLAAALAFPGCQADDPVRKGSPAQPRDLVVVAGFDFPESTLLAEIYAQALEAAGVPVRRELDLGPREMVHPALLQGFVDVVPEYVGSALATIDPVAAAKVDGVASAHAALDRALRPLGLQALGPAEASNQNGLVVTARTARRYDLRTVSDLRRVAPRLTFGAPPECRARKFCLVGLTQVYGLRFADVVALDTAAQRVAALEQGVVDVALLFTTDGRLAVGDLLLLTDDRHLQPAENVVPVVSRRAVEQHGDRVVSTLEAVSARLTTRNLVFLNWRVGLAGKDVTGEARGWLRRHGLIPSSR